mgnify:CR=1 FL=1
MKNQFKKRCCTECNAYATTASILKGLKEGKLDPDKTVIFQIFHYMNTPYPITEAHIPKIN